MKFDNVLMTCVRKDLEKNLIPMLLGEPGIGKSSWLMALADMMHTKCFVLACNQLADKADLTGARLVPVTDEDGNVKSYKQEFYPHAVIHDAIEYANEHPHETPILFMDELNRTTPDVTSEALSIPTLRAIGSVHLPNNLRVVIAGNDKGNVTSLDEASISRFVLYRTQPDVETFISVNPELNPFVRNVLDAHPECIFCKTIGDITATKKDDDDDSDDDMFIEDIIDDGETMLQITTPRTISAVSDWLNAFDNQELIQMLTDTHTVDGAEVSMLQEAIEGHIGATMFSAYLMEEIARNIMNTNNQSATLQVGKPAVYDTMKSCGDVNALNELIDDMSDNDRSGCLLYALYEAQDNTPYIKALSANIKTFTSGDMKTLMKLYGADKLDSQNVQAFLATNSPISQKLSVILES